METDSFVVHAKSENVDADAAEDVKKVFETFNYEVKRSLSIRKNKIKIHLMKDELSGKIGKEFLALRPRVYRCISQIMVVLTRKIKVQKKCYQKKNQI